MRFLNREDAYNDAVRRIPQFRTWPAGCLPGVVHRQTGRPEQHADFDQSMIGQPGVLNVQNQKDLVDRLFAVFDGLSKAAFAVALVQAIGAVLLIANMVQVAACHAANRDRHHADGRRNPLVHPAAIHVGSCTGCATLGVLIAIVGLILVRAAVPRKRAGPVLPPI